MLSQVIVTYLGENILRGIAAPKLVLHFLLLQKHYDYFKFLSKIRDLLSSLFSSFLPIVYSIIIS